ncbi:hypothetical protein V495_05279 [Pseudogymnoascus sp. VKM F-4514 (FW-929)]|nr:hypothetical protein V495_05279 [Pseudogymnoascus sp. VKM F-4514 (FW-929)]
MSPTTAPTSRELQQSQNSTFAMLQDEIAAATGTARSKWWDAHADATQAIVKNLKLHWKFSAKYPGFPNGDTYDQVSMLPRAHQNWTDAETQDCIKALQNGHLIAVAWEPGFTPEYHSEGYSAYPENKPASSINSPSRADSNGSNHRSRSDTPASVETTASPAVGNNKDLITSKHYQRTMERLRALLKDVTGYTYTAKQNTHIVCDNTSGPGAYKWKFSEFFRAFPPNPPSKWSMAQCRLVEEALEKNWVSVIPLPRSKNGDSPTPDHAPNNRPLRATTMQQRPSTSQSAPSIPMAQQADHELQLSPDLTEPMTALLTALNRDLTTAYDRTIASLTNTLHASASTHHTLLSTSLSLLSTALASEHSELSTLKQQIAEQSRDSSQARESELAQARAEGDAAGQARAIQDIGDVQNGLLRGHLEELVRVRREARKEGYEVGFRDGLEKGREGKVNIANPAHSRQLQLLTSSVLEAEDYNPAEFQLQAHLGIIGGRRPGSSGQKRLHDDDAELYSSSPPRATKMLKSEHRPDNRDTGEEAGEATENRLVLHRPPGGLATSFSGGLFLSSDEEVDNGAREVPHKDEEDGFSYF